MKKIILAFLIIFVIFILQQHFLLKNISESFQIPTKYENNYFSKYANIYCVQPNVYSLPPEADQSFRLLNSLVGYSNPVQNCLIFKYDFLKSEDRRINAFFKFDEIESTPENALIVIDNQYKSDSDSVTTLLLLHEMSNAYEFFKSIQTKINLSCAATEIIAYKGQTEYFNKLSLPSQLSLYLNIFSKSINNSSYENIRRVLSHNIKANILCFYDKECLEKNNYQAIEKLIQGSPIFQKYCSE